MSDKLKLPASTKKPADQNLYEILGLNQNASRIDVEYAYRLSAHQLSLQPVNLENEVEIYKFIDKNHFLNKAYIILSNDNFRTAYNGLNESEKVSYKFTRLSDTNENKHASGELTARDLREDITAQPNARNEYFKRQYEKYETNIYKGDVSEHINNLIIIKESQNQLVEDKDVEHIYFNSTHLLEKIVQGHKKNLSQPYIDEYKHLAEFEKAYSDYEKKALYGPIKNSGPESKISDFHMALKFGELCGPGIENNKKVSSVRYDVKNGQDAIDAVKQMTASLRYDDIYLDKRDFEPNAIMRGTKPVEPAKLPAELTKTS